MSEADATVAMREVSVREVLKREVQVLRAAWASLCAMTGRCCV